MEKMKALVFKEIGKLVLEERCVPHVKEPDDVVIKVRRVGICGTDVKIMEGKHHFRPDTVLGHEFCGEIVEVGSHVHHVKLGDRVTVVQQHPLWVLYVLPHGSDKPVRGDQGECHRRDA